MRDNTQSRPESSDAGCKGFFNYRRGILKNLALEAPE
jgi:hypothetical protein